MNRLAIVLFSFGLTASSGLSQVINEVRIDQPQTDPDEYFELFGAPNMSLDGLTYIVIGDGPGSGIVEAVVPLTGNALDANGYFVAAEATFTLASADLTTSLNFENVDNVTHLLVLGFTGAVFDDLDTNDDCSLDATPWTTVVDGVASVENTDMPPLGTECHYGNDLSLAVVGPDGGEAPGHIYRDGAVPSTWNIGAFALGTNDTPGGPNGALPVELSKFKGVVDNGVALLSWETASESGNAGFEVQHATGGDGNEFVDVGFISGAGTTSAPTSYTFEWTLSLAGTHYFRLKQVDFGGSVNYSAVVELTIGTTESYTLSEAYPNPFRHSTSLSLSVAEEQTVTVSVFDLIGRRVISPWRSLVRSGESRSVHVDASNLAGGTYLVRVEGQTFADVRKLIVNK